MGLEQQLRESYAERLSALDLSGGDVATARRLGARMRSRRRLIAGAAAVVVVAVALGGTVLGTGRVPIGPSHDGGHWRELPAPPLSPRADALSVWTGKEVIVLGGEKHPCPPNASCVGPPDLLSDGAAYDPATDTWRPIAKSFVPVGPGDLLLAARGAVLLRHLEPTGSSEWYDYDPQSDTWTGIGDPADTGDLASALGADLYVSAGQRRTAHYSVVTGLWGELPADRMEPRLAQRRLTATPYGLVVTGYDSTRPNDGSVPSLVLADLFDGVRWHRLPATGQVGNNAWFWTGRKLVDPEPGSADGGEVDGWGRSYPNGGVLDPGSGRWSPLAGSLTDDGDGWGIDAAGGRWVATYDQVYDTASGRVGTLPRPDGAPDYGVTATWADGRLLAFGGADSAQGYSGGALTNRAWIWAP